MNQPVSSGLPVPAWVSTTESIEPMEVRENETSEKQFFGHSIQLTSTAETILNTVKGHCELCKSLLIPARSQKIDIKVVASNQILHRLCLETWLTEQTGTWQKQNHGNSLDLLHKAKHYSEIAQLEYDVPVKCNHDLCTARGTYKEMSGSKDCPYPLSALPCQKSHQFLEKNSEFIQQWIKEEFENAGFKNVTAQYHKATHSLSANIYAITIRATDPGNGETISSFFYTSETINKGCEAEDCFRILLKDLGADLTIRRFQVKNPQAFDKTTSVYITRYDIGINNLIISIRDKKHNIPFDVVFNPVSRQYSQENLDQQLRLSGSNYAELLSNQKKTMFSGSVSGSISSHPRLTNSCGQDFSVGEDFPG